MNASLVAAGWVVISGLVAAASGAELAHRYSFNGNGVDSIGSANLQVMGGASFQSTYLDLNNASPGGGLHDDQAFASGAALTELAATIENAGGGALTIELWFNQDVAVRYPKVVTAGRDTANFIYINPQIFDQDEVALQVAVNGAVTYVDANFQPVLDRQYYLAMVIDDANDMLTLHVAGTGEPLKTFSGAMPQDLAELDITGFSLGSALFFPDEDFDGQVDELRIWDGALTLAEAQSHFQAGPDTLYRYDYDSDHDVDGIDSDTLYGCVSGPEITTPSGGCTASEFTIADADEDGDVDVFDVQAFMQSPFAHPVGIEFVDQWRYTLVDPVGGWAVTSYDDSAWEEGDGGFGTANTSNARVGTRWDASDIWLRKRFTIYELPDDPALWIHHDDDAEVYLNGTLINSFGGAVGNYFVSPVPANKLSALRVGENVLSVHCQNTGGPQFIDVHLVDEDHLPQLPAAVEASRPYLTQLTTPWGEALTVENNWTEYPRPMLQRDSWQNLNGYWDYRLTAETREAFPTSWEGQILVPFCLESKLGGVRRALGQGGAIWYRRSFDVTPVPGERTLLNFEAVDYECKVYVNGQLVGEHRGGSTPFTFDITDALVSGVNELIVRVEDDTELWQLRGKQVLYPGGIWYTRVSGIWQTVWLEQVSDAHIEDIKITTDAATGTLSVQPIIAQPAPGQNVLIFVRDNGIIVGQALGSQEVFDFVIPNAKLWSPDAPHLYDLEILLTSSGGAVLDRVTSYAGIRTVGKAFVDGHWRFTLNGEVIFHWGQLDQGWWPDGLLTPPSDEAMIFDIQFQKDGGFNMIRKHITVEPRRWYYHCDRIGMMVWQDQPSGGIDWPPWTRMDPNPTDSLWPASEYAQYLYEFDEMISALENHPSIVSWIPFNEAWGQHNSLAVGAWTVNRDPSRLVNIASGGNFWEVGDVADHHQYGTPGFTFQYGYLNNYIKVIGEMGGVGGTVTGHTFDPSYVEGEYNATWFRDTYIGRISTLDGLQDSGIAGAVYTQTTDLEREHSGLLTYDRRFYKIGTQDMTNINSVLFD